MFQEVKRKVHGDSPAIEKMGIKLPQKPRLKKVVEYADEEARMLGHNFVDSEHLLLGLTRDPNGVALEVLTNQGITAEQVREEVIRLCS